MEKNKKLVVNFDAVKRVLSTITAGVCLITLAGCAKNDDKDTLDISNPPRIEEPVESNTQDVEISSSQEIDSSSEELVESNSEAESEVEEVVDPNAPAFDIQDDEVFQSKVDELFAKIEGMEHNDGTISVSIADRSQAELLIYLLNSDSLSNDQLHFFDGYKSVDAVNEFVKLLACINWNNIQGDDFVFLSDYICDLSNIEFAKNVERLVNNYKGNCEMSPEDIIFLMETAKKLVDDVDNEKFNNILGTYLRTALVDVDQDYNNRYGIFSPQLDEYYELLGDNYDQAIINESISDLDDVLNGIVKDKILSFTN